MNGYLKRILNARVYDVAIETPLEPAPNLSARTGNTVLLKREDMQPVFSFKLRGAYNKMAQLTPEQLRRGVITASAGNHAQGVALAAHKIGCKAVIVMPTTTPQVKVDAVRHFGQRAVESVLHGDSYSDAYTHALQLEKKHGLTFVHPFDDPDVIAGQGTIGMEILRQHQAPIHAIFVPIGGGGLIAGVAAYVKQVRPDIRVIGVQSTDSDAMYRSLKAKKRVQLADVGLFADGTAVKQVGEETLRICKKAVDEIVLVDTDALCAAIKDMFQDTRSILEPSGALAVAGAKLYAKREKLKGETLVAIASGANMNFDRLRFVAERAEIGEQREALLAVTIPETPGSFRKFCALLGKRNITEFNYRYADPSAARVFVGIQVRNRSETAELVDKLERSRLPALDLSDNEMAKLHLRHLVGGHAPDSQGRDPVSLRISRAARRADELPQQHEPQLEHQPVPLPQPRRRFRSRAGRHAGAAPRQEGAEVLPRHARLPLLGRERQSGIPLVPGLGAMPALPQTSKAEIRKSVLALREELPAEVRAAASAAISARITGLQAYRQADAVLGYMNFGAEFASEIWIPQVLADGKRLALPRVNRHTNRLDLYWVDDIENQLAPGLWGIREPVVERCERLATPNEVEFALLPGVAFSRNGARLGYGGGFYDKLLADMTQRPALVAAAFALQLIEQIPQEATDVKVEWIITEQETIACAE